MNKKADFFYICTTKFEAWLLQKFGMFLTESPSWWNW